MATKAELQALEHELNFIKGNPQYYNRRAQCMSGFQAQSIREGREKGIPEPDAGVICLEVLKHSADVENNPAEKAERPDKDLLGPYRAISADKGFKPTDKNAKMLLAMYTEVASLSNVKAEPTAVKIPYGNPPVDFYLTQGSALDSAFTNVVLDTYAGKPAPQPTARYTPSELANLTDFCFRNKNVTIGQCSEAGAEQAAIYLQGKSKRAATR